MLLTYVHTVDPNICDILLYFILTAQGHTLPTYLLDFLFWEEVYHLRTGQSLHRILRSEVLFFQTLLRVKKLEDEIIWLCALGTSCEVLLSGHCLSPEPVPRDIRNSRLIRRFRRIEGGGWREEVLLSSADLVAR